MNNTIWIYWESFKGHKEPPYISLCRWTMLHQWQDATIIFVNEKNVEMYLPGILKRIGNIEVDVRGRIDLFTRKFTKNTRNLAVKSDVIRAHLLRKYGGIYVDASVIAFKSMKPHFETISERSHANFLASQRNSHGKDHYPVNFYGCNRQSKIMNSYCHDIDQLLKSKRTFHYNELGASALKPVVESLLEEAIIIDEKKIQPISFEDAQAMYVDQNISVDDVVKEDICLFKLFHSAFDVELKSYSIEQLYYMKGLLGKLFRLALPESEFVKYLNASQSATND